MVLFLCFFWTDIQERSIPRLPHRMSLDHSKEGDMKPLERIGVQCVNIAISGTLALIAGWATESSPESWPDQWIWGLGVGTLVYLALLGWERLMAKGRPERK